MKDAGDITRRGFLRRLGVVGAAPLGMAPLGIAPLGMAPLGIAQQTALQDSLAGRGAAGTLRDPSAAGRPRERTAPGDSDAAIQAVEQRLACTCGCTLDIFTCRTTDFTCTYSPELHREVLALFREGKSGEEIVDAFVAKYGEKALMAPKPEGFNLAGYLLPGAVIAGAGAALLAVISHRRAVVARAAGGGGGGGGGSGTPAASADVPGTAEEMERLRRALEEVES